MAQPKVRPAKHVAAWVFVSILLIIAVAGTLVVPDLRPQHPENSATSPSSTGTSFLWVPLRRDPCPGSPTWLVRSSDAGSASLRLRRARRPPLARRLTNAGGALLDSRQRGLVHHPRRLVRPSVTVVGLRGRPLAPGPRACLHLKRVGASADAAFRATFVSWFVLRRRPVHPRNTFNRRAGAGVRHRRGRVLRAGPTRSWFFPIGFGPSPRGCGSVSRVHNYVPTPADFRARPVRLARGWRFAVALTGILATMP